jgi:hypothetical protein
VGARCCRLRRCYCCCLCATMLPFTSTSCSSAALHSYSGRIVFAEHSPSAAAEWPVTLFALFALLPFFALPFLPLRCAGRRDMNGGFFRRGVAFPIGQVELQRSMIEVYTLHFKAPGQTGHTTTPARASRCSPRQEHKTKTKTRMREQSTRRS